MASFAVSCLSKSLSSPFKAPVAADILREQMCLFSEKGDFLQKVALEIGMPALCKGKPARDQTEGTTAPRSSSNMQRAFSTGLQQLYTEKRAEFPLHITSKPSGGKSGAKHTAMSGGKPAAAVKPTGKPATSQPAQKRGRPQGAQNSQPPKVTRTSSRSAPPEPPPDLPPCAKPAGAAKPNEKATSEPNLADLLPGLVGGSSDQLDLLASLTARHLGKASAEQQNAEHKEQAAQQATQAKALQAENQQLKHELATCKATISDQASTIEKLSADQTRAEVQVGVLKKAAEDAQANANQWATHASTLALHQPLPPLAMQAPQAPPPQAPPPHAPQMPLMHPMMMGLAANMMMHPFGSGFGSPGFGSPGFGSPGFGSCSSNPPLPPNSNAQQ